MDELQCHAHACTSHMPLPDAGGMARKYSSADIRTRKCVIKGVSIDVRRKIVSVNVGKRVWKLDARARE